MYKRKYTGKGIGVAVLDTGIFPHIDFGRRILAFCDFTEGKSGPYDDNGHGTHVSGILGGDGTASQGRYKGLLPDVALLRLKCWIVSGMAAVKMYFRLFSGLKILEKFIISAL